MKPIRKLRLEEVEKQVDDWKNNQYTHVNRYKMQALSDNPQEFVNFRRDKGKDVDAGKAFLGRNKRRRRRDVIEKPKNVVGPR
jgi:hypothetical protein